MEKALGLYVHVPFCKSKCAYCDFYSLPGKEDRMDAYTEAVCTHLRGFAPRAAGYQVDTVYFGGGTPSLLGPERLNRIRGTMQEAYRVAEDAEVTLEANPDSVGDWLSDLRGFHRISLGMQSADDGELRAIGRIHTFQQVRTAVERIRQAGFGNLSLDLIYGLPAQTLDRWQSSVSAALDLEPEHLSCYGLKLEPGTPLYQRREALAIPDEELQSACYLWTVEELARRGFRQYEISNFAKPGRVSRHNWKYWTLGEYAGFGPGAHSDFGGERYAWSRDLEGYCQGVQDGNLSFAERQRISPEERVREWLMLSLRTGDGVDLTEYVRQSERSPERFGPFFDQCVQAGYAVRRGSRVALTPRGFLVSNAIIGEVLELHEKE